MYIDASKGSVVALIIFTVAILLVPITNANQTIEIIFTASTFLFAILLGFFISRLSARFDSIKESVAREDGLWLTFYKMCGVYGNTFQTKIADLMDEYYVRAFDFVGVDYYKNTLDNYLAFYQLFYGLQKYRQEDQTLYTSLLERLAAIEESRNSTSVQSSDRLSRGQWIIVTVLAGIVIFCLFALRTGEVLFDAITVALSTIVVLLLLITRDLENLRIAGRPILVESGQEVLEAIGKKRYYNQILLTKGSTIVPPEIKEYRVGLHRRGEPMKIKLVRR